MSLSSSSSSSSSIELTETHSAENGSKSSRGTSVPMAENRASAVTAVIDDVNGPYTSGSSVGLWEMFGMRLNDLCRLMLADTSTNKEDEAFEREAVQHEATDTAAEEVAEDVELDAATTTTTEAMTLVDGVEQTPMTSVVQLTIDEAVSDDENDPSDVIRVDMNGQVVVDVVVSPIIDFNRRILIDDTELRSSCSPPTSPSSSSSSLWSAESDELGRRHSTENAVETQCGELGSSIHDVVESRVEALTMNTSSSSSSSSSSLSSSASASAVVAIDGVTNSDEPHRESDSASGDRVEHPPDFVVEDELRRSIELDDEISADDGARAAGRESPHRPEDEGLVQIDTNARPVEVAVARPETDTKAGRNQTGDDHSLSGESETSDTTSPSSGNMFDPCHLPPPDGDARQDEPNPITYMACRPYSYRFSKTLEALRSQQITTKRSALWPVSNITCFSSTATESGFIGYGYDRPTTKKRSTGEKSSNAMRHARSEECLSSMDYIWKDHVTTSVRGPSEAESRSMVEPGRQTALLPKIARSVSCGKPSLGVVDEILAEDPAANAETSSSTIEYRGDIGQDRSEQSHLASNDAPYSVRDDGSDEAVTDCTMSAAVEDAEQLTINTVKSSTDARNDVVCCNGSRESDSAVIDKPCPQCDDEEASDVPCFQTAVDSGNTMDCRKSAAEYAEKLSKDKETSSADAGSDVTRHDGYRECDSAVIDMLCLRCDDNVDSTPAMDCFKSAAEDEDELMAITETSSSAVNSGTATEDRREGLAIDNTTRSKGDDFSDKTVTGTAGLGTEEASSEASPDGTMPPDVDDSLSANDDPSRSLTTHVEFRKSDLELVDKLLVAPETTERQLDRTLGGLDGVVNCDVSNDAIVSDMKSDSRRIGSVLVRNCFDAFIFDTLRKLLISDASSPSTTTTTTTALMTPVPVPDLMPIIQRDIAQDDGGDDQDTDESDESSESLDWSISSDFDSAADDDDDDDVEPCDDFIDEITNSDSSTNPARWPLASTITGSDAEKVLENEDRVAVAKKITKTGFCTDLIVHEYTELIQLYCVQQGDEPLPRRRNDATDDDVDDDRPYGKPSHDRGYSSASSSSMATLQPASATDDKSDIGPASSDRDPTQSTIDEHHARIEHPDVSPANSQSVNSETMDISAGPRAAAATSETAQLLSRILGGITVPLAAEMTGVAGAALLSSSTAIAQRLFQHDRWADIGINIDRMGLDDAVKIILMSRLRSEREGGSSSLAPSTVSPAAVQVTAAATEGSP